MQIFIDFGTAETWQGILESSLTFLHRHAWESLSCAEILNAIVIVELVFILIINFQHTILS